MLQLSFSLFDLEYFLLILVRVSCFVFVAPFFSLKNAPGQVRIGLSVFTSLLIYEVITPAEIPVTYNTVTGYAVIVMKEAIVGLVLGFGATLCSYIVNFAGSVIDMETGLAMATIFDPSTNQSTSITGGFYQYVVTMMLIATGMYRYLLGAIADSFTLIPVNGAVFRQESLLGTMISFMGEYIVIGFRICLPVFCVMMLLNAILGVLAKVSPQMNMFAVGIQLKIVVGLSVMFFTVSMLPGASDFIFQQMKKMISAFAGGMM
ncbi:MAG: flagellar biosynthetic protein FliR [Lachnospiraceae bacterium]|nr:flagellar biosynthetic protein FliR [Lachnospiraceae bacterium]